MKKENNQVRFRMNIGAPSIILLLVVFALTIFALLSIRASYNELQLARTSRESVDRYYKAESEVERAHSILDAEEGAEEPVFYVTPIDDKTSIAVKLSYENGEWRMLHHIMSTEQMEGYNASPFDILDPIWIDEDDIDIDTDESFWSDDITIEEEDLIDDFTDEDIVEEDMTEGD